MPRHASATNANAFLSPSPTPSPSPSLPPSPSHTYTHAHAHARAHTHIACTEMQVPPPSSKYGSSQHLLVVGKRAFPKPNTDGSCVRVGGNAHLDSVACYHKHRCAYTLACDSQSCIRKKGRACTMLISKSIASGESASHSRGVLRGAVVKL